MWHKDGLVDCGDIWYLAGYDVVLPRIKASDPPLSPDDEDPDALCYAVWLAEVDTRRTELREQGRGTHLRT